MVGAEGSFCDAKAGMWGLLPPDLGARSMDARESRVYHAGDGRDALPDLEGIETSTPSATIILIDHARCTP